MPIVTRHPPQWAVHTIYMVPSDYVLRDRFGVAQDEAAFMQIVENQILAIRQWYWDVLGAGKTFDAVPATYYRASRTTAEMFATYPDYYTACISILQEMAARGLYPDLSSRHRLPNMYLPLDMEGAGNAIPQTSWGSPWFPWGGVVGAGAGGRILGGMFPYFLSVPTTIGIAATSGATSLTVSSGNGRNLALAAGFGFDRARVQSISSPTTSTTIVLDRNWSPAAVPFDAVLWPYGQSPTPSNAESIRVTAISGSTVTVQRARNGTNAISVTGGGANGGGTVIAPRQKSARIWTSPALPEGSSSEVVSITAISGDVLTVVRGQEDAYFYGNARPPRAILVGDNIAVTEPPNLWFYQKQSQAAGAFAHELGHNFGMIHYTPAEVQNNPYVQFNSTTGNYDVLYRDRTGEQRPSVDSITGVDFWEHLPHTLDNPLTPGDFGPYVMYPYWDWPYGNVASPAAGFTANEAARVLASPYLTTQARP